MTHPLEHTKGGSTTKDSLDAGVPMKPGDPEEPVGPEDALDPNARGDYSNRLGAGESHTTEVIPDSELKRDAKGNVLPDQPRVRIRRQAG